MEVGDADGGVAGAVGHAPDVEISGTGQDFGGPFHVSHEFALFSITFSAHFWFLAFDRHG